MKEFNSHYNGLSKVCSPLVSFTIRKCNKVVVFSVYDSWGHFPSGILSGNEYDFGYFDECSVVDMSTQYCLVEVKISMILKPEILRYLRSRSPLGADIVNR